MKFQKSHHRVLMAIGLGLIVVVFTIGIAKASNVIAEVPADQVIKGIYIRTADRVSIKGEIQGDVVVAGSTVEIDGVVNGSVYAIAEKVVVKGVVKGNIHLAGSEVKLSSTDVGSAFVVGENVFIDDGARLQNLFIAGNELTARGETNQNVYGAGSKIIIASKIGGDLALAGEKITIANTTTIGGNFSYDSPNEATIENDRSIQGSIKRTSHEEQASMQDRIKAQLADMIYWLVANILIASALLFLMPKIFIPKKDSFLDKPLNNYFKALAFVIFVPVALIVVMITVIGVPLALIGLLLYVLVLVLAPTASAHFTGRYLINQLKPDKKKSQSRSYLGELAVVAVGFVVLAIVGLVPILGGLVTVAVFFLGVATVLSRSMDLFTSGQLDKKK